MKNDSTFYRPDIDGLRAVAIVSVVFFHAHFSFMQGGFIGVDIFFVISGFLITSIILRDLNKNNFSFKRFYKNRIRRIIPALLVMLIFASVLAGFLMLPDDLLNYRDWLYASLIMLANLIAAQNANDYFAPAVNFMPLLHLWSLGVEEQFYVFFPILLFLLNIIGNKIRWLISFVFIFGMVLSLNFVSDYFNNFYLLPARVWELLCGSLLAAYRIKPWLALESVLTKFAGLILILGMGIILVIVINLGDVKNSIGVKYCQVLTCLGTFLIIATSDKSKSVVSWFLTCSPMISIGKISYSLYLWHWPLLSFYAYWLAGMPVQWYVIDALIGLSFLMAFLSWKYIERPFLAINQIQFRRVSFSIIFLIILLICFGSAVIVTQGNLGNSATRQLHYAAAIKSRNPLQSDCLYKTDTFTNNIDKNKCTIGNSESNSVTFLVWGDSHADAIVPAFDKLAQEYHFKGMQMSMPGNPTLLDVERTQSTVVEKRVYQDFIQHTLIQLEKMPELKHVFLINRTPIYALGSYTEHEYSLGVHKDFPAYSSKQYQLAPALAFQQGLEKLIDQLIAMNKHVWLVLPVPEVDRLVPTWLAMHVKSTEDVWVEGYPLRRAALEPLFAAIQSKYGNQISFIDPATLLCRAQKAECLIATKGDSLYYDDNHLSVQGAQFITDIFEPAFRQMKQTTLVSSNH